MKAPIRREDGENESSQKSSEQDNTNVPPSLADNVNRAEDPQCCFERVQPDVVSDNAVTVCCVDDWRRQHVHLDSSTTTTETQPL